MKLNFNKKKVALIFVLIGVLAFAFWYGGNAPGLRGWKVEKKVIETEEDRLVKEDLDDALKDEEGLTGEDKESSSDEELDESKEIIEKEDIKKEDIKKIDNKKLESRPGGVEGGLDANEKVKLAKKMAGDSSKGVEKGSKSYSKSKGMEIDSKTGKDKYLTDPVPDGKPIPIEPQDAEITDEEGYCTLSVRCDTILDNLDWLNPEKIELVPEDGVIYASKEVKFYKGESVFNVLLREMKKSKIHMEFVNTPIYNSVYIQGINNLYEFDCGELSGWMYKVNDWFPNYGASRYGVKEGDLIEWVYTCDLGVDVGGFSAIGGE